MASWVRDEMRRSRLGEMAMEKADRFGLVGTTIDEMYEVENVVAEGGYGVVYRAHHLTFRSPVALKCLKLPLDLTEEQRADHQRRFFEEAEIQFRLSAVYRHIVRPLHVGEVRSDTGELIPFLILEWLEGESLEELLRRRRRNLKSPFTLLEIMKLVGPAARALHHCHQFPGDEGVISVIHRDVKPDNLFVTQERGEPLVKLLDFGVAKLREEGAAPGERSGTNPQNSAFSPAYGAPEQWVPESLGQTGPWTDVWGLALCLTEAIAGKHAITGAPHEMMGAALRSDQRPTPRSLGTPVSDEVEEVFSRALAVDPRDRYRTVRDFWMDLRGAYVASERRATADLPPMSEPQPASQPQSLVRERITVSSNATLEVAVEAGLELVPIMKEPRRVGSGATTREPIELPEVPASSSGLLDGTSD